jgi:polygalacturonase
MTSRIALAVTLTAALAATACGSSSGTGAGSGDTPKSSDATLAGLAVGAGVLSPAFAPAVTSYAVVAPHGTATVTVTPTAASAAAHVTVALNGGTPAAVASGSASAALAVPAVGGSATVAVVVTAEDGTTRPYTITLTQAPSADASLAALAVDAGTLTPAFAAPEPSYAVTAPWGTAFVAVTPTASDPGATITIAQDGGTPAPVASGSPASVPVPAVVDSSTISIVVTAQDGSTTRTYTVRLTAAPEPEVTAQWGPVSAPTFPPTVCTTLAATLTPTVDGSLDPLDADSTASQPDRARIQAAITACPAGQAVKLVVGAGGESAFLSGPLTLKSGVTLWVDAGVTLFASRNPADYDTGARTCGTATVSSAKTCTSLIYANGTTGSGIVGDGVIDGRGGSLLTSGPNAFYRTWWDVAYENKVAGLNQQNPRLVQVSGGGRFTLYRITIQNAPNFHVVTSKVAGVTAWGLKLLSPSSVYTQPGYACASGTTPPEQYSSPSDLATYAGPSTCFTPDTVKNTDGFDPGDSTSVVLAYSWISVGDDHVAIKASSTGSADVTVSRNHFYYGHGMSIGSETNGGVRNVRVEDLSIDGQDSPNQNGLRIKTDSSRGGLVTGITYERVCMRGVRRPLVFDPFYSSATGALYPRFTNVVLRSVHSLGSAPYRAGELTFAGYVLNGQSNYLGITLDGVVLDGGIPTFATAHYGGPDSPANADFLVGPGPLSFAATLAQYDGSNGVTVGGVAGTGPAFGCGGAFPSLKSAVPTSPF